MTVGHGLPTAGASEAAIAHHYDLPDDFFRLWLGADLTYSCGLWGVGDDLAAAQTRKIDWFARRLDAAGRRMLDVGCGWGALLDRFGREHGSACGVGLTLSVAQARVASARELANVEYRHENWLVHEPDSPYDAIVAVESTEHFASDAMSADEKVEVYRTFFERAAEWLTDGGRLGLQVICLDGVGHQGSRLERGPVARLLGRDIFPESMASSLSEMVLGWDTRFRLLEFAEHTGHYVRTFAAWAAALRAHRDRAEQLVGPDVVRTFERYFAASQVVFRLRDQALYRVVLAKRPEPKVWIMPLRPSAVVAPTESEVKGRAAGASAPAITAHYDISNDFFGSWLGPSMMYSSAMWGQDVDPAVLDAAMDRKIDYFAGLVLPGPAARVVDIGCGWGGTLRRLITQHGVQDSVGLTLSRAQHDFIADHPIVGADIRVEDWQEAAFEDAFDAIVSFGAFEHFARDGMSGVERVERYQRFFQRCYQWLHPGGRVGLETIAHDGAPDSVRTLGRGPLGDSVLELFPQSLCPHVSEVVVGFEPWFEVQVLRSDAADFARTFRAWQLRLRAAEPQAVAAAGNEIVRRFRRYLAASEIQFRDGTLTNLRLVLRRRADVKY